MGPRLFGPKSENNVLNKAVNVGQILGKMGGAKNGHGSSGEETNPIQLCTELRAVYN